MHAAGVGSLKLRKYTRENVGEIVKILDLVRSELKPNYLHAFGLNIQFLRSREIVSKISSTDLASWVKIYARFNRVRLYDPYRDTLVEPYLTWKGRKIKFAANVAYL